MKAFVSLFTEFTYLTQKITRKLRENFLRKRCLKSLVNTELNLDIMISDRLSQQISNTSWSLFLTKRSDSLIQLSVKIKKWISYLKKEFLTLGGSEIRPNLLNLFFRYFFCRTTYRDKNFCEQTTNLQATSETKKF